MRIILPWLYILFAILFSISSQAKDSKEVSVKTSPKNKWESPPKHTLTTQIGIQGTSLEMNIKGNQNQVPALQFRPNSPTRTYLGLGYGNLGLSLTFANDTSKEKELYYGSSTVTDYRLIFFGIQHSFGVTYQNYSGYYIENSSSVNSNILPEHPRIQRPDLTNKSYGFEYYYTFSPSEYSLEAAYSHSARQSESGGSWIGIFNLTDTRMTANDPIVPSVFASQYGEWQGFKGGEFLSFNPGIGYGGKITKNSFYLTGLLSLSFGLQRQRFDLQSETFDRWVMNGAGSTKIGLGYNGKKFFSGLQLEALATNVTINDITLSINQNQVLIFLGMRTFDLPLSWLDPINDWFATKEAEKASK